MLTNFSQLWMYICTTMYIETSGNIYILEIHYIQPLASKLTFMYFWKALFSSQYLYTLHLSNLRVLIVSYVLAYPDYYYYFCLIGQDQLNCTVFQNSNKTLGNPSTSNIQGPDYTVKNFKLLKFKKVRCSKHVQLRLYTFNSTR